MQPTPHAPPVSDAAPRPRRPHLRRLLLASLVVAAIAAPVASGCGVDYPPGSELSGLRVLAVVADQPYGAPGESVTLTMTYVVPQGDTTPVAVAWLGGCKNPENDAYYACYSLIADEFAAVTAGAIPAGMPAALGEGRATFTLRLPDDLITSRKAPAYGPAFGIGIVFFAACAGRFVTVPAEGSGQAGSFPLGCVDQKGTRLGAEAFVPGYTQLFAFADGRRNANPVVGGLTFGLTSAAADAGVGDASPDGGPSEGAWPDPLHVPRCGGATAAAGCGATSAGECAAYDLDVLVSDDIAEPTPDLRGTDGAPLREIVWVSYFSDGGTIGADVKLVSDATTGPTRDHGTTWTAPSEPGPVRIYAVVRDARGGSAVVGRTVYVD